MKKTIALVLLILSLVSVAIAETTPSKTEALRVVKFGLEDALSNQSYRKVQCNESGIIVWMADEGTADKVADFLTAGYDSECEPWMNFKQKSIGLFNSIRSFAVDNGVDDPQLMFLLVDDINFETVLLAIKNEEIIFDIMRTSDAAMAIKDIYGNKRANVAEPKEFNVPAGKYTIGVDIPAGVYTVTDGGGMFGAVIVIGNYESVYPVMQGNTIGKLELVEGETIEVQMGSVKFSEYKGIGF